MELLPVLKKKNLHNPKMKGIGLIESLVALALFSAILALWTRQTENVNEYKKAKIYSDQTTVFARDFANQLLQVQSQSIDQSTHAYQDNLWISKYKKDLIIQASNGQPAMEIVPLADWDHKSIFGETPCLLLYYDNSAKQNEMSGILYYASKVNNQVKNKDKITLKAINVNNAFNSGYFKDNSKVLLTLKNSNGDNIINNNGWGIKNNLIQFMKNNSCGTYGTLSDDSLLLNMQLIPEFNNRLVSVSGLQKTSDQSYSVNIQGNGSSNNMFLPGHLYNNNTFKSNLSIKQDIILQNGVNGTESTLINVAYGSGNNTTVNIGKSTQTDNSAFITSAIQPNNSIKTGSSCLNVELGKVAIAQRETITQGSTTDDLARNLVTCSKNATLCSTGYCYLPIKSTTFSFSNANGLQDDTSGQFKCPSYAPYIVNFTANLSQPNVDVFVNKDNSTTGSYIKTVFGDDGQAHPWTSYSNVGNNNRFFSRFYNCSGGCQNGMWAFLRQIDFSDSNITHGSRMSIPTASVDKIYNDSASTGLKSPVGLQTTSTFTDCNSVCSGLNQTLGGSWGEISSIASGINDTISYLNIPNNKCACGKLGGQSNYWIYGIALVENVKTNITNVICSNYPEYQFQ